MLASDTVSALERGHITEAEAIEQSLVDDVDTLYAKAGLETEDAGWGCNRAQWPNHIGQDR
ncbi:hypothetical protein VQ042_00280 [Aurantimonas sp. A2-1-M11]|uniref:hypothetical protein n=1 Tax=Aurantimonas sp. A2-1-M11 TaxID=3113712 RepID=UPI002F948A4B